MPHFTDTEGRRWELELNIGLARRIKSLAGVDLLAKNPTPEIAKIIEDLETLVNVLWIVCERQAQTRDVDEEDFAWALGGETFHPAVYGLLEAIVNFSPPHRRGAMAAAVERIREIERRVGEKAKATIESPRMEDWIERKLSDPVPMPDGAPSGSSPESSASNRAA